MQNIVKKLALWLLVSCCVFSMLACKNNTTDGYNSDNSGPPIDSDSASSIDNDSIPPIVCTQHSFQEQIIMQPTCIKWGSKIYTCKNCGMYYMEDIRALGHEYASKVTREPSTTLTGIRTYTCTRGCGDSYREDIPRLEPSISMKYSSWFAEGKNGERGSWEVVDISDGYHRKEGYINYSRYEPFFVSHDWSSVYLQLDFDVDRDTIDYNKTYQIKCVLQLYKYVDVFHALREEEAVLVCEQECLYERDLWHTFGVGVEEIVFEFNEPLEDDTFYEIRLEKGEIIVLE